MVDRWRRAYRTRCGLTILAPPDALTTREVYDALQPHARCCDAYRLGYRTRVIYATHRMSMRDNHCHSVSYIPRAIVPMLAIRQIYARDAVPDRLISALLAVHTIPAILAASWAIERNIYILTIDDHRRASRRLRADARRLRTIRLATVRALVAAIRPPSFYVRPRAKG